MTAPIAAVVGGVSMAICQWLIYLHTPNEATMGISQKIFYLHLPLAWWALISFALVFISSIGYLLRRSETFDHLCEAAAEIGVLFITLGLFTGAIWGKLAWGVWWTWDPRLTTTLVMWFIYCAYLIIRHADFPPERKRIIASVIGIAAFADVPLVFFSARLFRSIHPAVFSSQGVAMESEMVTTLIVCIISLGCLWYALLSTRLTQLKFSGSLIRAAHAQYEKDSA